MAKPMLCSNLSSKISHVDNMTLSFLPRPSDITQGNTNSIPEVPTVFKYPRPIYNVSLVHGASKLKLAVEELTVVYENSKYMIIEYPDDEITVTASKDTNVDTVHEIIEIPELFTDSVDRFLTFWREPQGMYFNSNPERNPDWRGISSKILLYGPLSEICNLTMSTIKDYSPLTNSQIEGECQYDIVHVANILYFLDSAAVIEFIEETRKSVSELLSTMELTEAIVTCLIRCTLTFKTYI